MLQKRDLTKTVVHTKTNKAKKNERFLKNKETKTISDSDFVPKFDTPTTSALDELFEVHVRFQARNARKKICTFAGIPDKYFSDEVKNTELLKTLKATIAGRATIKKDVENGYIIEVSGDKLEHILPIIKKFCGYRDENLKIHNK